MTPQQTVYLVILVVSFALLLTERLRNDLVAVLSVLAYPDSGVDMQMILLHLQHYPRLWDLMPRTRLPGR